MTKHVIRAIAFASGKPCPHAGEWLKEFNHDAYDGGGFGVFTKDINVAMRFASRAEALAFWNKSSIVRPTRPDGRPNKPLTALTVSIDALIGGDIAGESP